MENNVISTAPGAAGIEAEGRDTAAELSRPPLMLEGFALPHLQRVQDKHEILALQEVADVDGHGVIAPSHLVMKGKDIVGYASIAQVPMVFCWVDSKRVRARESFHLLNTVEQVAGAIGNAAICLPCTEASPFRPYMAGLGYDQFGEAGFFLKRLRP